MRRINAVIFFCFLFTILLFSLPETAEAYIGPGAGFAFVSSFFILIITFLLAVATILIWPFRMLIRRITRKNPPNATGDVGRIVIIGLDGMDPKRAEEYMGEGKLPYLSILRDEGSFKRLRTTMPAMSPVAWSTFTTGVDPSRHNIFDFLNRDPRTYTPMLSSTKIEKSSRAISLGKYNIPIREGKVKSLRKGIPFWNHLGKYGIFSSIIRVPITFPSEKLYGTLLSAMCVPDLLGTQGTFTYYSSKISGPTSGSGAAKTGGVQVSVAVNGDKIKTHITGPDNFMLKEPRAMKIGLDITLKENDEVWVKVNKKTHKLKNGKLSGWIPLTFTAGLNKKVSGICRFYVKETAPDFKMYMSPINIDPENPSLPISFPLSYSVYLAKLMGRYATLGLAEDTWALNEEIIDEEVFLDQAYKTHREREEMLFAALEKNKKGLTVCVFDATDRIQHMFTRFLPENAHALPDGVDKTKYMNTIEDLYCRMDGLIGRVIERLNDNDLLMVISDHGFKPFKRGVNLNVWLYENGYLGLKGDKATGGEWFADIDWSRTKAYTFGLSGIYINEEGREGNGIVASGDKAALKKELMTKLRVLIDDEQGGVVAIREAYSSTECFDGPYKENGPDIFVCYEEGYRASWGAAVGKVEAEIFEDNKKGWSGDHCIDPRLVPGVIFSNRKISVDAPHIRDIAPSVLKAFGLDTPPYMAGRALFTRTDTERKTDS